VPSARAAFWRQRFFVSALFGARDWRWKRYRSQDVYNKWAFLVDERADSAVDARFLLARVGSTCFVGQRIKEQFGLQSSYFAAAQTTTRAE